MIQCDKCDEWYHGDCVGIPEQQGLAMDSYHCFKCKSQSSTTPAPDGSKYLDKITKRQMKQFKCVEMDGHSFTADYVRQNGFRTPVLVNAPDGLGMVMPDKDITVRQVAQFVGDRVIEVIDVEKQEGLTDWTLNMWADYFEQPVKTQLLNVISMEFSDSEYGKSLVRPQVVRELDLVNMVWPSEVTNDEFPKVQLYCLMSPQGCWTDFHIDFSATSVFYHIVSGSKTFLLIPPTDVNLKLYEKWCKSSTQDSVFFADQVEYCYQVDLVAGNTFFIPSGWIHAVYTPKDSIVIGGNFLHQYNMTMQLAVSELEQRCETPLANRFPYLETLLWYTARHFGLKEQLNDQELEGMTSLYEYLNSRMQLANTVTTSKSQKQIQVMDMFFKSIPKDMIVTSVQALKLLGQRVGKGKRKSEHDIQNLVKRPSSIKLTVKKI